MNKLLIDVNVIIDVGVEREPHRTASQNIFSMIADKKAFGYVCAASFPTLYYVLKKNLGSGDAREFLTVISELLSIAAVNEVILKRALALPGDYEDAIQSACAEACTADFIITRNSRDYRYSPVRAISPDEYLATRF